MQFGQVAVEFLAKGGAVELVEHRLVKALADPVGLSTARYSSYSCRSGLPQYSEPRSVRMRSLRKRFLVNLQQRMEKFALSLHPAKTRLLEFGRYAAECRRGAARQSARSQKSGCHARSASSSYPPRSRSPARCPRSRSVVAGQHAKQALAVKRCVRIGVIAASDRCNVLRLIYPVWFRLCRLRLSH